MNRNIIRAPLYILPVLVMLILILSGCSTQQEQILPARPVIYQTIGNNTQTLIGPFTGTIQSQYKVDMAFELDGRVVSRQVNIGDLVSKGDVLAKLDNTLLILQLQSATAGVANSQAILNNTIATETRTQALVERSIASRAQLEAVIASREAAETQFTRTKTTRELAERQLDNTTLQAEFDGVVTAINAEVGELIASGKGIVTIVRPTLKDAVIDVPEPIAAHMELGTKMTIQFQIDTTISATGIVREIAASTDSLSQTRRIRLALVNPDPAFRLGTLVSVFAVGDKLDLPTLPASAILRKGDQAFVWIADPDTLTVTKMPIEIQEKVDDRVSIIGPFSPGDRVVIAGVKTISEGQTIRFLDEVQP